MVRTKDYRGFVHPRHAGMSSMPPVNTDQPHDVIFSKNTAKIALKPQYSCYVIFNYDLLRKKVLVMPTSRS